MKQPTNILTESVRVDGYYSDWHFARHEAARRIAHKLAQALVRSEFNKPQIALFHMVERRNMIDYPGDSLITGRLVYQSFNDWARENLVASDDISPFGKVIPIPLSNEYMMAEREGRFTLK